MARDLSVLQREHAKVIVGPDANLRVTVHPYPVQYKDSKGDWTEIAPGIDKSTAKAVGVGFNVEFQPKLTDSGAIVFASPNGNASFGLQGYGLAGLESIPFSSDGLISSDGKITYFTEWGKVIYEITRIGLKETIYIEKDVLEDPTAVGITLTGLTVNLDFNFAPVDFESNVIAIDARGRHIHAARSVNGIELNYTEYKQAVLPLEIDPTLLAAAANDGYLHEDNNNTLYAYSAQSMISYGVQYSPATNSTDSNGCPVTIPSNRDAYRQYIRFDLSSYVGYTIYGTCTYSVYQTQASTEPLCVDQIQDFGTITTSTWYAASIANIVSNLSVPTINSYVVLVSNLKAQLLSTRGSFLALKVYGDNENPTTTQYGGTCEGANTYPPKLDFNCYNTLTQNAASPSGGMVTVSWIAGGGLISGDFNRVYFMAGTSLTGSQIIANNTYIDTTAYTDTSINVPGLTNGTNYCFVVVDVQVINGTQYQGAVSNVVEATPSGATVTYQVSFGADTARSIKAMLNFTPDTKRHLTTSVTDQGDTNRIVAIIVNTAADTVRKVAQIAQAGSDMLRKIVTMVISSPTTDRKVVASDKAGTDSYRKVTNTINTGADTKRRLQKLISTATDTIRRITLIEVINFTGDMVRKVVSSTRTTTDTKRKLVITDTSKVETKRKTQVIVTTAVETLRRFGFAVNFLTDTLRQVGSWITRKDPQYAFSETAPRYTFKEDVPLYMLRVGEQREVGITGASTDSSQFSLSATYVWVDTSGKILAQGSADIEGVNVFTMVGPTKVGRTTLTFTVTVTPLDSSGSSDQSRKPETYLISVTLKVLP